VLFTINTINSRRRPSLLDCIRGTQKISLRVAFGSRATQYFTSNNTSGNANRGNANRGNATAGGKEAENKWGGLNFRCSICRPCRMLCAHPARAQFCRCPAIFARKHVYVHVRAAPFARLILASLFLLIDPSCLVFTSARHLPTDQQFVDVHSTIV